MKISKLLNKNYLTIFIISIFFLINPLNAEDEPIDIWDIEKIIESDESQKIIEEDNSISNSIIQLETNQSTKIKILKKESLNAESIKFSGLYDPEENGLNIDMWINSDGNEIKSIFNRINKINLSKDAKEILNTTLLTNSYFPVNNISEILNPASFSIILSISLNSKFKFSERRDPIIDFPEPIIPIKTRFLFEFIVLY